MIEDAVCYSSVKSPSWEVPSSPTVVVGWLLAVFEKAKTGETELKKEG